MNFFIVGFFFFTPFYAWIQVQRHFFLHCSEENSIFFIAVKKILKSQIFLHCNFFSLCLEQPVKFKKAICSFIFLFFLMLKFFLAVRKYFKMVHSGVKMGPRTLLKFLVSLKISKLGPLAHFYSLMDHFEIFLTARKNFLIAKREK